MSESPDSVLPESTTELTNTTGQPEPVLTHEQWQTLASEGRTAVDDGEDLDPDGPDVASGQGDYNHEDHIGDEVEDDDTAEINRMLGGDD